MSPLSIAALSLSMSADAFAAALGKGAAMRPSLPRALKGGLVFGVVEGITPLIGWAIGFATASFIAAIDHWVAFTLLAAVGGKMIHDAFRADDAEDEKGGGNGGALGLVLTAVGTSMDAAAVGVSLALIGVNILVIALSIGFATFVMTTIGMMIGRAAGARFGSAMEVVGGLVLIWIGSFILFEHLGLLG